MKVCKVLFGLLMVLVLIIPFSTGVSFPVTQSFSCDHVQDVPVEECNALGALFKDTDGDNWDNNDGWGVDSIVANWHGVTVDDNHVTRLSLNWNNLYGHIPPELNDLEYLEWLYLANNELFGTIPSALGDLEHLITLTLCKNNLSGSIPPELGNLTNLRFLRLSGNQLKDEIPSQLGNLVNLISIESQDNQLSGSLPSSLGQLEDLESLILYNNQLEGRLPSELGNLSELSTLLIYNNPLLSGPIPMSFINLNKLATFSFGLTALCEPQNEEFLAWRDSVPNWYSSFLDCEDECCWVYLPLVLR